METGKARAVAEMEARMAGHRAALEQSLAQRAAVLDGLTAWIRLSGDAPPEDAFRDFAASLYAFRDGVRALQLVREGRIVASFPPQGNQGVEGFDLRGHPDPTVPAGLRRALAQGTVTVTGPIELIQGGAGVILRRSAGEAGDTLAPSAAMVVDVATLVEEAGIRDLPPALSVELEASDGIPVFGAPIPAEARPVRLTIGLPEGSWDLLAAPSDGWTAAVGGALLAPRLGLVAVVALTTLLAFVLAGRDARLAGAVRQRTAELEQANQRLAAGAAELRSRDELLNAALVAGRVWSWSWELGPDRIWWAGGTPWTGSGVSSSISTVEELVEAAHAEDRGPLRRALEDARRTGALRHEYRVSRVSGGFRWVRVEGVAAGGAQGAPERILGASADISRVKDLEAELVHTGRLELIGRLAGGVAHDINNALTVIQGELELGVDPSRIHTLPQAAKRALGATQYASLLLAQLLTFSRKDVVQPTAFRWDEMCTEVTDFLGRLLGDHIRISLALDAGDAAVLMDRAQAMQVVTNLAVNARDAMPAGGTLNIRTRVTESGKDVAPAAPEGACLVLEVSDTGSGIPEALGERVFEPFFTTKATGKGTGLGLATTQGITREAGGEITFRTSPEGTTFIVVLPLASGATT